MSSNSYGSYQQIGSASSNPITSTSSGSPAKAFNVQGFGPNTSHTESSAKTGSGAIQPPPPYGPESGLNNAGTLDTLDEPVSETLVCIPSWRTGLFAIKRECSWIVQVLTASFVY